MKDPFDYKFELVKQEMETVQKGIDIYNRTIFAVKGLAMTLFTAFIAFIGAQTSKPNSTIFWAMAFILLLFWILDALFKSIQKVYIDRSLEIERQLRKQEFYQHLAEDSFESFDFPRIEHAFEEWGKNKFAFAWAGFRNPTVCLVYVSLIFLDGVVGAIFYFS
jgi:hypothetical protein